ESMITPPGAFGGPKPKRQKPTYQARQPLVSSRVFPLTTQFRRIYIDGYRWRLLRDLKTCSDITSQMRNTENSATTSSAIRKTILDHHGSDRLPWPDVR